MTAAAKDTFSAPRRTAAKGSWRRLWQVPLLVAGVVGFGFGIRALVHSIHPVPFEKQVQGVEGLIAEEKFADAIKQINVLAPYYTQPAQQAELQKLAGDTTYLAQKKLPAPVRENYQRIADHYEKAVGLGMVPTVEMNQRWGEAALALGDARLVAQRLEAAIEGSGHNPEILNRYARDLVAAYLDEGKPEEALHIVERVLADDKPLDERDIEGIEQRTWALCTQIEIALSQKEPAGLEKAVKAARQAIPGLHERDPGGRVLVWIGRAELERGQTGQAEKDLAEARSRFAVHHIHDGRATVLLARILAAKGDLPGAAKLFQEVVTAHAGTTLWAAARLGRADTSLRRGILGTPEQYSDYQYVISALMETHAPVGRRPEMLGIETVRTSLLDGFQRAWDTDKLEDALKFLALAEQFDAHVPAEMVYRQAITKERRAREILDSAEKLQGTERAEKLLAGRTVLAEAAEDFLQHGELTTLNDEQSGASKWKGAALLDTAGETLKAIAVYQRLTIQRPHDAKTPEGLLALGRLYVSAGELDQAAAVFQRNIKENSTTPASYTSVVELARVYTKLAERAAKPEEKQALQAKAEGLLLGLVQENTGLEPTAREFRESLLALGELYYDSRRWGDAILRLDEVVSRYPTDPAVPRVTFMLGESYRKSAADIAEALKSQAVEHRTELDRARAERLMTAAGYFSRVISMLDVEAVAMGAAPARKLTPLEEQYLRISYMDRAGCLFDRGDYEQAVKLYDETSARFSDELVAVEAYVQIVNAYVRMNLPQQASAAAERGQWILQRVPDAAMGTDAAKSRDYYKRVLTLK